MPSLSPGRNPTHFGKSRVQQDDLFGSNHGFSAHRESSVNASPPSRGSDRLFSIVYLDVPSTLDVYAGIKKAVRKVPDTGTNIQGVIVPVVQVAAHSRKPTVPTTPATPSTVKLEDHVDCPVNIYPDLSKEKKLAQVRGICVSQPNSLPPLSESKSNAASCAPISFSVQTDSATKPSTSALRQVAQIINRRSSSNRSVGLRSQDFLPEWDDEEAPDFFSQFPRALPGLVVWPEIGIAMFANGQSLKHYQALDLYRIMKRERGEMVCGTNAFNNTGYLVAYPMGYGKTPLTIALILYNPPPKDFGGENRSRATLIAVPNKGIMSHWRSEIEKFAPQLTICFFDSCRAILDLKADVILLTYDQLKFQRRRFLDNPNSIHNGRIFRVMFWRFVGDEFHFARNPDTKLAATLLTVQKRHGLCLTGTPAQNSLRDFWIIFKFLGVIYENIDTLEIFDRKIYSKRQKGPIVDPLAKKRLDTILADFSIFRNPIDPVTGKELVPLPKRTDVTITVTLSREERFVYEFIKDLPKAIFARIMRRRQACDHPMLLSNVLELTYEIEKDLDEDPDMINSRVETEASSSVTGWPTELRHCLSKTYLSSKLAIMKGILERLQHGSKAIIFTNFEKLFPAIAHVLEEIGIRWVEYSGNMTVMQRDKSLQQITSDPNCTVIIVSIMAGGTGLNIIACDTVIVMEPWWNPYAEESPISIGRAHRIGQTRPVQVHHLVTETSIEESIMKTQQVKRDTIGGLYGACAVPDDATYAAWLAGP